MGSNVSCHPAVLPCPAAVALPVETETESLTAIPSLQDSDVVRAFEELVEVVVPDAEPFVAWLPADCAACTCALWPCEVPITVDGVRPLLGRNCTEPLTPLALPAML